jgi:hypothetical protein
MQTHFITDINGKKVSAVLPIKDYEVILEQLDELACIQAYDIAKPKKNKSYVSLKEAVR